MNAAQIQNLIIQNSKGLSAEILQEVLDFMQFLKTKKSGKATDSMQILLSDLNSAELSHLEEEFADYETLYLHE